MQKWKKWEDTKDTIAKYNNKNKRMCKSKYCCDIVVDGTICSCYETDITVHGTGTCQYNGHCKHGPFMPFGRGHFNHAKDTSCKSYPGF